MLITVVPQCKETEFECSYCSYLHRYAVLIILHLINAGVEILITCQFPGIFSMDHKVLRSGWTLPQSQSHIHPLRTIWAELYLFKECCRIAVQLLLTEYFGTTVIVYAFCDLCRYTLDKCLQCSGRDSHTLAQTPTNFPQLRSGV